jgi:hypothetical protein
VPPAKLYVKALSSFPEKEAKLYVKPFSSFPEKKQKR